ncbi:MAG: proline dehydrogenase family protein [Armatimonadetes bacterium]|nr:proline dehydrogenase family protein [Armatimonadota bacterium]
MLARSLILKTSAWGPVERMVRKSFLFKPLVRRFIAGDSLEEAIEASNATIQKGMFVSLDFLGENTKSEAEALAAKATYIRMLETIAKSSSNTPPKRVEMRHKTPGAPPLGELEATNISIKLTQCGLDQGEDFAETNYREVLWAAAERNTFVRVDMESSEYTERTVKMIQKVHQDFPNTGTVLQSYLVRTDEDVELMIQMQARVRLVKGAYLEPANVAIQDKAKVDEAYVRQAKRLLEAAFYPAIATHDEKIINELNQFVSQKGIAKESFEYQMLYGIRRDLQDKLVKDGYNVRVYIPFGDSWYPYFTRRLAERPANAFFILKSLFKG